MTLHGDRCPNSIQPSSTAHPTLSMLQRVAEGQNRFYLDAFTEVHGSVLLPRSLTTRCNE